MLPKLFGYDSKGKVKEWSVETEGAVLKVTHGQVGGKMQSKATVVKGKNIGRANETTPEEQAVKEAQSKWNKQIDKNYHEDIAHCIPLENPMLAHDFRKQGHRITYPAYTQPKLDGVRCLVKMNSDGTLTFKSRGNKEYPIIEEIQEQLLEVFEAFECDPLDLMLDGELYIHGESLQTIISAVKKHIELDEDGNEVFKAMTGRVEFHMFDYVIKGKPTVFQYREDTIEDLYEFFNLSKVKFIRSALCYSKEDLVALHTKYCARGYEGLMVRNAKGIYTFNTRSADLQKFKLFTDEEFECIDVFIDKDGFGVPVLSNHHYVEGTDEAFKTFKATWKGTHEARALIAKEPHRVVSKQLTVQYQTLTDGNVPQFPISVAVRDYE